MVEGVDAFGIGGLDAACEQERCVSLITLQDVPVKLLATPSIDGASGFEEEVIDDAFVAFGFVQVGGDGDGNHLDDLDVLIDAGTKLLAVVGCFISMQLDEVETEGFDTGEDILYRFVDECTNMFAMLRQISGHFADEAWRMGIEDESHPIDTCQGIHLSDVVRVAHSADFHYHGLNVFNGVSGVIGLLGR